jgi:hypothetical protein
MALALVEAKVTDERPELRESVLAFEVSVNSVFVTSAHPLMHGLPIGLAEVEQFVRARMKVGVQTPTEIEVACAGPPPIHDDFHG